MVGERGGCLTRRQAFCSGCPAPFSSPFPSQTPGFLRQNSKGPRGFFPQTGPCSVSLGSGG